MTTKYTLQNPPPPPVLKAPPPPPPQSIGNPWDDLHPATVHDSDISSPSSTAEVAPAATSSPTPLTPPYERKNERFNFSETTPHPPRNYTGLIIAGATLLALAGAAYGGYSFWKYEKGQLPDRNDARSKLMAILPSYVNLETFKMEGVDATTVKFEGTITPIEDLFTEEDRQPDLTQVGDIPPGVAVPPSPAAIVILNPPKNRETRSPFTGKF
jgi:hypothetical protein